MSFKENDEDAENTTGIAIGTVQVESVISNSSKNACTLLHSMNIDFPEGKVTAILGPSGSGKTTLLNFATGNISKNSITAHGLVAFQGQSAYVPQDDRLHGFYTCDSYLSHYSRLSGQSSSSEDTKEHINSLLASLGLTDHRSTIVGDIFKHGLSGGQKRRLSIALEALSKPKNFFLDEPTSGLDSESALKVLEFLKEYARESPGRRVILTIHQPSSFLWKIIDNVVLLSRGRLIYQGKRSQIEDFFCYANSPTPPDYNPADHFVAAINDEFTLHERSSEEWSDLFFKFQKEKPQVVNHEGSKRSVVTRGSLRSSSRSIRTDILRIDIATNRGSTLGSSLELTRRYFANLFYNPGIIGIRVAMYSMLSLLIGALFWDLGSASSYASIQSRIALNYYCLAFFVFMSVAVLPFTVMERGIVDKEVRNGYYHPAAYQVAQAISTIPGTAILAFISTLIVLSMTGLREPVSYFINMFLALECAEALAQLVSHIVPHFIIGMALIAAMYGFFMLLMGFMLVPSEFPLWLRWLHDVAFHTYSWRSFMYKEFGDDSIKFDSEQFPTGWSVLEAYEIEDVNFGNDMIVLFCYVIIIHLLSFLVLHVKYRSTLSS